MHLVASRAQRQLSGPEVATLAAALDDGLSVFQAGDAAARQQLLAANVLAARALILRDASISCGESLWRV